MVHSLVSAGSVFPTVTRLGRAGWAHVIVYGALLPCLVLRGRHRVPGARAGPPPERVRHYQGAALELLLLTAGSLAVASVTRMDVFPRALPPWRAIGAGLAACAVAVLFMRPRWQRAVTRNVRGVHLFLPNGGLERARWILVSALAGIGEAIPWRGVQAGLLAR